MLYSPFSTTPTGKLHESQIYLYGRIDYSFVPSTIYEGRCTENLRHVMMKVRYIFLKMNWMYICWYNSYDLNYYLIR